MADNRGGKRKGAGRKPGRSLITTTSPALDLQAVKGLTALQALCALLSAMGYSDQAITRTLGEPHPNTLTRWKGNPYYRTAVEQFGNLEGEPWGVLAPAAIKTLAKKLVDDDLDAAKYVTDQRYGKPIVRQVSQAKQDIHVYIHEEGEPTYTDH